MIGVGTSSARAGRAYCTSRNAPCSDFFPLRPQEREGPNTYAAEGPVLIVRFLVDSDIYTRLGS